MGIFRNPFRSGSNSSSNNPDPQAPPATKLYSQSSGLKPTPKKSLSELEKELEAQYVQTTPLKTAKKKGNPFRKLFWRAALLGIPVGAIWLVNLPYPLIRRPVAEIAPILLLPSYISWDNNFKQATSNLEQASQLIGQPTSAQDIERGGEILQEAKANLDALPSWFVEDWADYYPTWRWYDWRFTAAGFYNARTRLGELEAKVFQEQNALTTLAQAEETISSAKQNFQQAQTSTDKQLAIADWRAAIKQLEIIPSTTFAGSTAQQKLRAAEEDLETTAGIAADNERRQTEIEVARQYAWQAAKESQNPPHTAEKWGQIAGLWQEAINYLDKLSQEDLTGYAEAQRLRAQYKNNLGQIEVRREAEQKSVAALGKANQDIENLIASIPDNPDQLQRNRTTAELQGIINELEKVEQGTTAYLKAQELLLLANNKLNELQTTEAPPESSPAG